MNEIFSGLIVHYVVNAAGLYEGIGTTAAIVVIVCVAAFERGAFGSTCRENIAVILRTFNVGKVMLTADKVERTL